MQEKFKSEAGTFRELLFIYKNLWLKTRQGRKWTKWDRMFFQFGLTIIMTLVIVTTSIVALLNN